LKYYPISGSVVFRKRIKPSNHLSITLGSRFWRCESAWWLFSRFRGSRPSKTLFIPERLDFDPVRHLWDQNPTDRGKEIL